MSKSVGNDAFVNERMLEASAIKDEFLVEHSVADTESTDEEYSLNAAIRECSLTTSSLAPVLFLPEFLSDQANCGTLVISVGSSSQVRDTNSKEKSFVYRLI